MHIVQCWPGGVEGVDYIECSLCKFAGCKITQHVKNEHGVSKEEYIEKYGMTMCTASTKNYRDQNTYNSNWINRKKELGESLDDYRQKMSRSVSESIMSNDAERMRRSALLGELNKTKEFREKSSVTAKKTSSRRDIQLSRAERLRDWRNREPEKFQKIIEISLQSRISRPEKKIYEICAEYLGEENLTRQLQIKHSKVPTKSHHARVDIACKEKKIMIEFDGPFHFKPITGEEDLIHRIKRDNAVEEYAIENGWLLVRVSYEFYKKKKFEEEFVNSFIDALNCNKRPEVIRMGMLYETIR